MCRYATILLLLIAVPTPAQLQEQLDRIFDTTPDVRQATWTCGVRNLADGALLYERNLDRPLIPASNQKLVVMAAALLAHGAGWHAETVIHAGGPVREGVLQGDLVIVGEGAIHFTARYPRELTAAQRQAHLRQQVWQLADGIRGQGVNHVTGRVVPYTGPLAKWHSVATNTHYACVGPLTFNENTVDIDVKRAEGSPVADRGVTTAPEVLVSFEITRRRWPGTQRRLKKSGSDVIEVNPDRDSQDYWRLEAMAPGDYYCRVLQAMLATEGITFGGAISEVREPADPLLILSGLPLYELLPPLGVYSDNFRAEQIFLALGCEQFGTASFENGGRAVLAALQRSAIDVSDAVAADGSGLSRDNRLSSGNILSLLDHMRTSPHADLFASSLAVAGRRGTLTDHLHGVVDRVYAKTGTLSGVKALSGYVLVDGRPSVAFAMIGNGLRNANAAWPAFEDALGIIVKHADAQ